MKVKANVGYHAEKLIARVLGLKPVPYSGSRWQAREDGECSHFLMQHKSTNVASISVKAEDVFTLIGNAGVSRKHPLFVLEYLRNVIQIHNETPALRMLCIPFTDAGDIDAFCKTWQSHNVECLQSETEGSKPI